MPRILARLPRPLTALLTCPVGPTGDAYCDTQCRRNFGPDSTGECWPGPNSSSPAAAPA
jgi:hypothetical protein